LRIRAIRSTGRRARASLAVGSGGWTRTSDAAGMNRVL